MAAADVEVSFAAGIEKLLGGINEGTDAVKGFAEHVQGVTDGIKAAGEAVLATFGTERIIAFAEKMGELGLQTERSMAQLGATAEQVGLLSGVATLTGTSLEGMTNGIERMSLNIQKSTKDGFNPAAEGLKALGLNAQELIGLPADQYFERLAAAVSKFNPSLNLTNAIMAIGGRGIAQLIPMLMQGKAGFEEFEAAVKATGAALSEDQVRAFAESHIQMSLLSMSAQGFANELYSHLVPAIESTSKAGSGFLQWMRDAIKDGGAFSGWADGLATIIKVLATATAGLTATVLGLAKAFQTLFLLVAGDINDFEANAEKMAKDFESIGNKFKDTVRGIWTTHITVNPKDDPKQNAGALDESGAGRTAGALKGMDGDLKVMQQGLAQKRLIYDAEAAQFQITQDQKFALLQKAVQQEAAEEMTLLQRELQIGNLSVEQRQSVENKIKELKAKTNTELVKLDEQSIAAQQAAWLGYINTVTGAFNSQLKGLLQGTVTWSQAMKNMLLDLTVKFIEMVEKWAAEWLAGQLGMTTATTTGAAARAAAEAAAQTATLPERAGKFVSDITANAAVAFAGIFANLAPLLGPAAAGPAAAGQATVLAELADVPKLDVGGFVLSSGLAMIHKGETVTPASTAPFQGGSGGGVEPHFHIHAADTQTGYQLMVRNLPAFARELKRHMDQNHSYA